MKLKLIISFLLLGLGLQAQVTVDNQYYNRSKSYNIWNGVVPDSILAAPRVKATKGKYPGSIMYNSALKTLEVYDTLTARWYPLSPILFDGLISGGVVSWTGTGLNFYISEADYILGGAVYHSNDTTVTLATADPTNPRQDVIALNNIGVYVLTGTPAADPAKPQVTPGSELELTSVLINAGATTPDGVTQYIIWDENTESTVTGSLTFNADNTSNPFHLTKAVDVSSHGGGGGLTFTLPSGITLSDYSVLVFYIRLKGVYTNTNQLNISWAKPDGIFSTFISSNVNVTNGIYGYDRTVANQYQTIQIPMSAFNFSQAPTDVNKLSLTWSSAGAGFYIDYIQLQSGVTVNGIGVNSFNGRTGHVTPLEEDYARYFLDTVYRRVDSVFGTKDGVERFLFKDSTGAGSSYTFSNGVKESAGNVTAGGQFEADSISYVSNSDKTFRVQSRLSSASQFRSDWWQSRTDINGQVYGGHINTYGKLSIGSTSVESFVNNNSSGSYGQVLASQSGGQITGYDGSVGRQLKITSSSIIFSRQDGALPTNIFYVDSSVHYKKLVYDAYDSSLYSALTLIPKRYLEQRLAALPSAATVLDNVGTGFDLAQQGTDNVKRLQAAYGINLDSVTTANTVRVGVDTALMATKARVKHVADSLGYIISGESVAWGTYAQRIALTPTNGQRFTQTDYLIGEYVYNNGIWQRNTPDMVFKWQMPIAFTSQFTRAVSGAGAAFEKVENDLTGMPKLDSIYGAIYEATTGSTSTGSAYISTVNNYSAPPKYISGGDTNFVYVMHYRIHIAQAPTAAQDFRLFFGGSNYGSGPLNDTSNSRFFFRLAYYRNATNIESFVSNSSSSETYTASLMPFSTLINRYVDYVIIYNTVSIQFWIEGVKYYEVTLTDKTKTLGFANPFIGINKTIGTTAATIRVSNVEVYRTKKR